MEFPHLLARAARGGGILFCGAGFSADSLNLPDQQELGTGSALLALLNNELAPALPFKDLKNAADKYVDLKGEFSLLALLRDRFKVSHVTDDMVDIVRFPWDRIYTTNYDNAVETACSRASRNFKPLNNLDASEDVPGGGIEIVHLHGYAERWDIKNFRKSCILGADSYFEADKTLGPWAHRLRDDFERAQLFVFAGFSAGDFHLNRVFFNATEAKPKVFFINRPTSAMDPDLEVTQEKFGRPLALGLSGLATLVRQTMNEGEQPAPFTPSYRLYIRPEQAAAIPSVEAIRELLIFGKIDRSQIVRDISSHRADYHVVRQLTHDIAAGFDSGLSIVLLTGEICDGKSLITEELCAKLSISRPVYTMYRPYDSMIEETSSLIATYNNPVFLIENCFDLSSRRLEELLALVSNSQASLVFTSRAISARAEVTEFQQLSKSELLRVFQLPRLNDHEIEQLVRLSDQIAGWAEFPRSHTEKLRFIREHCRASLPAFLLELLKSEFVRKRYAEEYRKTADLCSHYELSAIVAALYIAHIGHDAPLSLLSDIFRVDIGATVKRFKTTEHGLHLVRVEDGYLRTVPSIGASRILREIVPTQDRRIIVDTVVKVLEFLSDDGVIGDYQRRLSAQLMRYSILATVVDDVGEQNRFFDNVSKIDYCRTQVLFWLQWHMAMLDQKRFSDADTYLRRSYTEAQAYERRSGQRYDLFHVDDRKAKFLMVRDRNESFRETMFYDLRDACQITERLLRRNDLTHHPFDTFAEIVEFFEVVGSKLPPQLREVGQKLITNLGALVETRARMLKEGYQVRRAKLALDKFSAFKTQISP